MADGGLMPPDITGRNVEIGESEQLKEIDGSGVEYFPSGPTDVFSQPQTIDYPDYASDAWTSIKSIRASEFCETASDLAIKTVESTGSFFAIGVMMRSRIAAEVGAGLDVASKFLAKNPAFKEVAKPSLEAACNALADPIGTMKRLAGAASDVGIGNPDLPISRYAGTSRSHGSNGAGHNTSLEAGDVGDQASLDVAVGGEFFEASSDRGSWSGGGGKFTGIGASAGWDTSWSDGTTSRNDVAQSTSIGPEGLGASHATAHDRNASFSVELNNGELASRSDTLPGGHDVDRHSTSEGSDRLGLGVEIGSHEAGEYGDGAAPTDQGSSRSDMDHSDIAIGGELGASSDFWAGGGGTFDGHGQSGDWGAPDGSAGSGEVGGSSVGVETDLGDSSGSAGQSSGTSETGNNDVSNGGEFGGSSGPAGGGGTFDGHGQSGDWGAPDGSAGSGEVGGSSAGSDWFECDSWDSQSSDGIAWGGECNWGSSGDANGNGAESGHFDWSGSSSANGDGHWSMDDHPSGGTDQRGDHHNNGGASSPNGTNGASDSDDGGDGRHGH